MERQEIKATMKQIEKQLKALLPETQVGSHRDLELHIQGALGELDTYWTDLLVDGIPPEDDEVE